jgi:DNA-binding response OmpR family regulator
MVLIDDEEWLIEMMELAIRGEFKNVDLRAFQDSKKAWQELAQRDPDILITGANMGELSGEEIVRRLIEQKVAYPILVMSGWSPAEKWVKSFANKKPNISFLQKPFTTEQLHAEISKLLGRNDKPTLNIIGLCPKCGMEVLEGSTSYFCRGKECGFKIAGVVLGQVLNSSQASKLLQEGRTDLLSEFISKNGHPFSAWLILDKGKVVFDFPKQDSQETTESPKPAAANKRRASDECKPLIDAATKDLFLKNAFRITGLPVDATTREVAKQVDKIKIHAELGQGTHTQGAAFPIKPPPTLDEIREAIQKLKDPEKRLIDEFFWFWPEEFGENQSDVAIQALAKGDSKTAIEIWNNKEKSSTDGVVASHNLALVYHITALDWEKHSFENEVSEERRQKIVNYWKEAFDRWEILATNERLWEKVTTRIRQLNEPNLPTGFARRMRAMLPEALDKINAELAIAFAESGKIELARLHIQFMRETHQGLDNVERTAELVLTPARNRSEDQIRRAEERAKENARDAASAARELLKQAQSAFALYDLFFTKDSDLRNDFFDKVASACNRLQIVYYKATNDDKTCLEILKVILPLATSTDLKQLIEKDISETCARLESKKLEPVYALLKSIQDSTDHPSSRLKRFNAEIANVLISAIADVPRGSDSRNQLFDSAAIVLRGISLEAWNKHEDRTTAVAANELAIKYAFERELKQRLAEDKATLQQMGAQKAAAEAAKRESSKKTGVGCLVVVAIFILWGIIGSCNSNTSSSNSSYTPSPTPSAPTYTPSPVSASGNSDGNVYQVPSSVSSTLDNEKAKIESERTTLAALDAQVAALGREIENDRLTLDNTSQSAVDDFNAKVDRYNLLVQQDKDENAAFNEKVDNYNAKLRQYGQ